MERGERAVMERGEWAVMEKGEPKPRPLPARIVATARSAISTDAQYLLLSDMAAA